MISSCSLQNAFSLSPYNVGILTSKMSSRQYAVSSIRVVVLLAAQDIPWATENSLKSAIPLRTLYRFWWYPLWSPPTIAYSKRTYSIGNRRKLASAQSAPATSTPVWTICSLEMNLWRLDLSWKKKIRQVYIADSGMLIPQIHRIDRLSEFGTASFVNASHLQWTLPIGGFWC